MRKGKVICCQIVTINFHGITITILQKKENRNKRDSQRKSPLFIPLSMFSTIFNKLLVFGCLHIRLLFVDHTKPHKERKKQLLQHLCSKATPLFAALFGKEYICVKKQTNQTTDELYTQKLIKFVEPWLKNFQMFHIIANNTIVNLYRKGCDIRK